MRQKPIVRFEDGNRKRNAIFQHDLRECHANELARRNSDFGQYALGICDATFVDARAKHHGRIAHGTTVLQMCRAVKPARMSKLSERKLDISPRLRRVHTQDNLWPKTRSPVLRRPPSVFCHPQTILGHLFSNEARKFALKRIYMRPERSDPVGREGLADKLKLLRPQMRERRDRS